MNALKLTPLLFGLTACTTLSSPAVVDTLREVCAYEPAAYALFQVYAPQATPQVQLRVYQAHLIVTNICANPPTDIPGAFAQAFAAYLIVSSSIQ